MEFCGGIDISCDKLLGFAELFSCLSLLERYCAFQKEGLELRSVGVVRCRNCPIRSAG